MTALAICYNPAVATGDLAPPYLGQLNRADLALRTLIHTVLFTNARVETESQLPSGETSLGGHWADLFYDASFGSLLWTLRRELNVPDTHRRAKRFAEQALTQWIPLTIASAFEVEATRTGASVMDLTIVATLPTGKQQGFTEQVLLNAA